MTYQCRQAKFMGKNSAKRELTWSPFISSSDDCLVVLALTFSFSFCCDKRTTPINFIHDHSVIGLLAILNKVWIE